MFNNLFRIAIIIAGLIAFALIAAFLVEPASKPIKKIDTPVAVVPAPIPSPVEVAPPVVEEPAPPVVEPAPVEQHETIIEKVKRFFRPKLKPLPVPPKKAHWIRHHKAPKLLPYCSGHNAPCIVTIPEIHWGHIVYREACWLCKTPEDFYRFNYWERDWANGK